MTEEKKPVTPPVQEGEIAECTVEQIMPYGAFVRLKSGQRGMIHISELSASYVKKVEDILQLQQEVRAKVIKIDEKGRIDLSLKAMQPKEPPRPVHHEEDFEKKLSNFMKFSDEKIADLNSKCKDPRAAKRRTGNSPGSGGKRSYEG